MSTEPLRVAASMTIDPDGAMDDWIDLPPGWTLQPIPTQEIIHLVGVDGYQSLLLDVVEQERPAILLTHPPYDYVTQATARALSSLGTRLVGYAFDDDIFALQQSPARAFCERIYDRYVTTHEVRWATRPLPLVARRPPEHDLVLVGRAYPRRVALVEALRQRGHRVTTRGLGWPDGFVDRAGMLALYGSARIVLTTADWEDCDVRMVKHRVLDTATLGVFQIVERSADLAQYFGTEEIVAYDDLDELCVAIDRWLPDEAGRHEIAARARMRCHEEHTWQTRWPELVNGLEVVAQPRPGQSRLLDQSYATLAARAETDQRWPAAHALWSALLARQPGSTTATAGVGRSLLGLGRPNEAIAPLVRALSSPLVAASFLSAEVASHGLGAAMGHHGLWPPTAESAALLVAAFVEGGHERAAVEFLANLTDPALRRRLATVLQIPDASPALAAALARLAEAQASSVDP